MTAEDLVAAARGQMEIVEQRGDLQVPIAMVTDDSRAVVSGSLFVAVKGERVDGHEFVAKALHGGAAAVIAQSSVETGAVPLVRVANSRKALGIIGSRFYGDPSSKLMMVGVTPSPHTVSEPVSRSFLVPPRTASSVLLMTRELTLLSILSTTALES